MTPSMPSPFSLRRNALLAGAALALTLSPALLLTACKKAETAGATADANAAVTVEEAKQIATDAYVFGYSLLTSEVTRVQMTNVPALELQKLKGPMGQFINVPRYPPADYRGVTAPNADTLYSVAWLDLGNEPMVFSHPDMGKRFFLFPMLDLWTEVVASPGSRVQGGKAANYLITGPGWTGTVPAGMTQIKSPTRYLIILGRTYADGTPEDYKVVNALQAQLKAVPLSAWGKPYTPVAPPVDANPGFSMTDKVRDVIDGMDSTAYFNMVAKVMGAAAPALPADAPMLAKMARIGLVPGQAFDPSKLPADVQAAIAGAPKAAMAQIAAQQEKGGFDINGWRIPAAAGRYGTDYLSRAYVSAFGWGANLPEDAIYPNTKVDSSGAALNGANTYTLTFAKGELPPVGGFWSITMYDSEYFFVPNPLNRFTASLRNKPVFNPDGSLTLTFSNAAPAADKMNNWLPAPKGDFILMMRLYGPNETPPSILPPGKGSWSPPPVKKAS